MMIYHSPVYILPHKVVHKLHNILCNFLAKRHTSYCFFMLMSLGEWIALLLYYYCLQSFPIKEITVSLVVVSDYCMLFFFCSKSCLERRQSYHHHEVTGYFIEEENLRFSSQRGSLSGLSFFLPFLILLLCF